MGDEVSFSADRQDMPQTQTYGGRQRRRRLIKQGFLFFEYIKSEENNTIYQGKDYRESRLSSGRWRDLYPLRYDETLRLDA